MAKKFVLILVGGMLLAGCSVDYKAQVRSDTTWSGSFGNRSVDGSGNQTIDLPDEHPQCVVVQKDTRQGVLSVRVVAEGGGLFKPEDSAWAETTAEFGVVSACSEQ